MHDHRKGVKSSSFSFDDLYFLFGNDGRSGKYVLYTKMCGRCQASGKTATSNILDAVLCDKCAFFRKNNSFLSGINIHQHYLAVGIKKASVCTTFLWGRKKRAKGRKSPFALLHPGHVKRSRFDIGKIMRRTTDRINTHDNKLNFIGKSSLFVYNTRKGTSDGIRGARGRISPLVRFGWRHVEYSNFSPNGSFLFRACDTLERRFEGSASVNDSHSNTAPTTQRCPLFGHPRSTSRTLRIPQEMKANCMKKEDVRVYLLNGERITGAFRYDKIRCLS